MRRSMKLGIAVKPESLRRVTRLLTYAARRGVDLSVPAKQAAHYMHESVIRNFEEEGRPQKWKPWTPKYAAWRRRIGKPRPILFLAARVSTPRSRTRKQRVYAGLLKRSITVRGEQVGPFITLLSTSTPYAAAHQFGTERLPARPFFVFQEEDVPQIEMIFKAHIDRVLGEGGAYER